MKTDSPLWGSSAPVESPHRDGEPGPGDPNSELSALAFDRILSGSLLPELLREPDENALGSPNIAEPVNVFVIDDLIDYGRTEFGEAGERVVDVVDGKHNAQVSQ